MDLKIQRENENKTHEQLYNNLYLLSQFYPTSTNFQRIFRKDMFVKNNKAAFFEVVYYLLSTLLPEKTKQKLTTWPLYDVKQENKFRTEVLSYINEINGLYYYADIPNIMPSHLISPGGYKFTRFMLKLSELVVFEHLKKSDNIELHCPMARDNIRFHMDCINKQTAAINFKVQEDIEEFNFSYLELQEKAKKIVDCLSNIDQQIVEAQKEKAKVTQEFQNNYPEENPLQNFKEIVQQLNKEWSSLQSIHDLLKSCGNLLQYFSSNNCILEHKNEELKVPTEILYILKNTDQLDLTEYFQGLDILLQQRALDVPNFEDFSLNTDIQEIYDMSLKYSELQNIFTERKLEIEKDLNNLLSNIHLLDI